MDGSKSRSNGVTTSTSSSVPTEIFDTALPNCTFVSLRKSVIITILSLAADVYCTVIVIEDEDKFSNGWYSMMSNSSTAVFVEHRSGPRLSAVQLDAQLRAIYSANSPTQ